MPDTTRKAKQVKQRYEKNWLARKEVKAVGVGYLTGSGKVGIIVSVSGHPGKTRNHIPSEVEGVPVELRPTGEFRAQ